MVLIRQRLHLALHASFVLRPLAAALSLIAACPSSRDISSPSSSFRWTAASTRKSPCTKTYLPFLSAFCDTTSSALSSDSLHSSNCRNVAPSLTSRKYCPSEKSSRHQTMSGTAVDPDKEPITLDLLQTQGASSTNAIVHHFQNSDTFTMWSQYLSKLIRQRDDEDGYKLDQGIEIAIQRGTLKKLSEDDLHHYQDVDVFGKKPTEIADYIWEEVNRKKKLLNDITEDSSGELIVLCGLSGTGKGTTFAALGTKLREEKGAAYVVNWSNGNVFRSVTLLAVLWCEQELPGSGFDEDNALTKENIANFMSMLSFEKVNDKYDTRIKGLGLDTVVSKIENTLLKQSNLARLLPTVAEQIQGEVIHFANSAISTLRKAGMTILLEGREQTLNYINTPYKFRLVMSDATLIGKRRAAQLLMAALLERIERDEGDESMDLEAILDDELHRIVDREMSN